MVTRPPVKVRFCNVSLGDVASFACSARIRVRPPPLRVTSPSPSMTVSRAIVISELTSTITGRGPQRKTMFPPRATAATNTRSLQLSGVPVPTTLIGSVGLAIISLMNGGGHTSLVSGGAAGLARKSSRSSWHAPSVSAPKTRSSARKITTCSTPDPSCR